MTFSATNLAAGSAPILRCRRHRDLLSALRRAHSRLERTIDAQLLLLCQEADGRNVEAEAALRLAARVDPTFADAWYNLSDLLDEQGRVEAAIECLRITLRVAPDYADAVFNLALLLQRKNEYAEAADYWRRYLVSDCQSELAARARRSLKFCEMQLHLVASA